MRGEGREHIIKKRSQRPPNSRRRRYGLWLDRVAQYLKEECNEPKTANWFLENLKNDRYTPPSANSAAQKMMKDPRFGSFDGDTHDLNGHAYKTKHFYYIFGGEAIEE